MTSAPARAVAALLAAVVLVGAAALVLVGADADRDHRRASLARAVAPTSAPTSRPATSAPASTTTRPTVPPDRVVVPKIGVDAEVIRLGLRDDGTLEVPTDFAQAGWWSGGAAPGAPGPAVIVGHVDNKSGPAVFYRLRDLVKGDRIDVGLADGSTAAFAVSHVERYAKAAFPTDAVYGATPGPTLRLITCGGSFDRSTGHYRDNVVVYADEVAS